MTIEHKKDGSSLYLSLGGKLNTGAAVQLNTELEAIMDGVKSVVIDLSELEYISSSGIRIFLSLYKSLGGNLKIINSRDSVLEVFETSGFNMALDIE